jgi:hypothetical protein
VIPNGGVIWFYHSDLSSCGRRVKRARCGQVRSRNICFGHVPIAVCQGRQRRDAATAGEAQLGRCTAGRLYHTRRCICGELESLADSSTVGAPPPARVWSVVKPPAPAKRNLGVGHRRPSWGQTCGGMLGTMVRTAPARSATRPTTTLFSAEPAISCFLQKFESGPRGELGGTSH